MASQIQATAGSRAHRAAPGTPQAYGTRNAAATQVRTQRRRDAGAVLASLARSYAGRPIPEIQSVLRQALKPCGVRLSPDAWHDLAAREGRRGRFLASLMVRVF